jgi:hypothetical protein
MTDRHADAKKDLFTIGHEKALDLLYDCAAPPGFLASPTPKDNYRRVWPMITGFYAADLAGRGQPDRARDLLKEIHRANRLEMAGAPGDFLNMSTAGT